MADPAPPTTLAQPTPAHDPATATKDIGHGHGGFQQVVALARTGHVSAARVAELIVEHPSDKHHILEYLHSHKHFGNSFVQQVTHALAHAKKANEVNLDERKLNPDHAGVTRHNTPDHNRVVQNGHGAPAGGTKATLATACSVYQNDGTPYPIGDAMAGQEVQLNAGGWKMMKLSNHNNGQPTECVMAFYINSTTNQHVTGWVPKDALDAVGQHLAAADHTIEKKANHQHAGVKFEHTARKVKPVGRPNAFSALMTGPNQDPANGANMPDHYFARPGNVVNLLNNVPNTGTEKFGVAIDVLVGGTEFFEATPRMTEHIPMFEQKSDKLTNQTITFVFGKAQHGSQPASYGWINAACLG